MPRTSGRRVDYTQDEMMEMTGLSRFQFVRGLERVCDMYHFDITDFKVEKDNKDSSYFFPPEVADLLAILIRNLDSHPLKRTNAKVDVITGSAIGSYNKKVMEDIDDNVEEVISDAIYCREGHLTAQNISDWSEPFVKALARLLDNITTLKSEDLGASLNMFTKKLDEMNYCLFRGDYLRRKVNTANMEAMEKFGGEKDEPYYEKINQKLHRSNISIDWMIAEMIRWYLPGVNEVRDNRFEEYEVEDSQALRFLFGCPPEELTDLDCRTIYYRCEVKPTTNIGLLENNKMVLEKVRENNSKWSDIPSSIRKGTFAEPQERPLADRIKTIKNNIQCCEQELADYKKLLAELEKQQDEDPKNEFLKEIQDEYVEYCKIQDEKNTEIENVVDHFVGRALYELLK